ncbi:MAG: hypothetical protein GF384_03805 [Elusimicrobia bacterium]|nr:hypothetical protein [Elusimicrobiota bacterium]
MDMYVVKTIYARRLKIIVSVISGILCLTVMPKTNRIFGLGLPGLSETKDYGKQQSKNGVSDSFNGINAHLQQVRHELKGFIRTGLFTDRTKPPFTLGSCLVDTSADGSVYLGSILRNGRRYKIEIKLTQVHKRERVRLYKLFHENMPAGLPAQWVLIFVLPNENRVLYRFKHEGTCLKRFKEDTVQKGLISFIRKRIFNDRHMSPLHGAKLTLTVNQGGLLYLGSWRDNDCLHTVQIGLHTLEKGDVVVLREWFNDTMPDSMPPQWMLVLTLPGGTERVYRFTEQGSFLIQVAQERPHEQLVRFIRNGIYTARTLRPFTDKEFTVKKNRNNIIILGAWKERMHHNRIALIMHRFNHDDVFVVRPLFRDAMPFGLVAQWVLELELPDGQKWLYRFTRHEPYVQLVGGSERIHCSVLNSQ